MLYILFSQTYNVYKVNPKVVSRGAFLMGSVLCKNDTRSPNFALVKILFR